MKYSAALLLHGLYEQTEKNLSMAIAEWQQLPAIRLKTQPGTGQWSAIQCLEHLNSYGRYYLPAIEKAIDAASTTTAAAFFKSSYLGNYFYKLMLPEANGHPKKKMRSPKDHAPSTMLEIPVVLSEFISQQELLGKLLTRAGNIDINKARVPISIARFIKLKLGDTLLFYTAHINRHIMQAQRALEAEHLPVTGNTKQPNRA